MDSSFDEQPLSVAFRSLDVERATAPVGSVLCPCRGSRLPAANCFHCDSCRQIEFLPQGSFVSCSAQRPVRLSRVRALRVSDVVRAPAFCAGPLTTVSALIAAPELCVPWEAIPVLCADARPLGLITADALERTLSGGLAADTPLLRLMNAELACVTPDMSLFDAARWLFAARASHLVVTSTNGTFLGLVAEIDLVRELPAFRSAWG
jgi:CBS domain-containing protein